MVNAGRRRPPETLGYGFDPRFFPSVSSFHVFSSFSASSEGINNINEFTLSLWMKNYSLKFVFIVRNSIRDCEESYKGVIFPS